MSADSVLPQVNQGQPLNLTDASHEKKQTQPLPRHTEAKLVQVMERRGIGRPSTFAPTVKTLKERGYAEVQKRQLQATALGLEVDAFLQKTLPELLEAEFTAQMEDKLDAIAHGKENWERYIIGWNLDYFADALQKARSVIESQPHPSNGNSQGSLPKGKESKMDCPCCDQKMIQIPSKSKKLHKDHFLKCPRCQAVMFYNKWRKVWELPIDKGAREQGEITSPSSPTSSFPHSPASSEPLTLTDHLCPVCGEKLYQFAKDMIEL